MAQPRTRSASPRPWARSAVPKVPALSVIGLGTVVIDHQVLLERHPERDAKAEVLEDRYQVGGPVPTALALLRKFGLKATFVGQWGRDPFGAMIEKDLRTHGIAFQRPKAQRAARTGFAHVWVERPTGRRTIAGFRGTHTVPAERLPLRTLARQDALHLDGWSGPAALAAARVVRGHGGKVFLDLGSPKPGWQALLKHVDVLSCPSAAVQKLLGRVSPEEALRRLREFGPTQVTLTLGERGALLADREGVLRQPAFRVRPVDTTGAGDVFNGAMIFATLLEWPRDRRLPFACAAAALKCRRLGNRDALPSLHEIEMLLTVKG